MNWSMNWEGWIDVSVQCLPDLIKAMELMEHVKPVVLKLARRFPRLLVLLRAEGLVGLPSGIPRPVVVPVVSVIIAPKAFGFRLGY